MNDLTLLKLIMDDPHDHLTKLAYADLLEENCQPKRAWAWRWVASWGRVPGFEVYADAPMDYYWSCSPDDWRRDPKFLPMGVFMSMSLSSVSSVKWYYDTIEEAYTDLIEGLMTTRKDLRIRRGKR